MRVDFASCRPASLDQDPLGSLGEMVEGGKAGRREECLEAACAQFAEESPFCFGIHLARSTRLRPPSERILLSDLLARLFVCSTTALSSINGNYVTR